MKYKLNIKDKNMYSKDLLMQGIARISGGILSFIAIFIFTYMFNEEEIGEYNLILATVNIITSITTLWLSQSILRFSNGIDELGSILSMTLCTILISVTICKVYAFGDKVYLDIWVYIYAIVQILYNVFDAFFRKERMLKEYVMLEFFMALGRLVPMVILAPLTHNYSVIFMSQSIVVLLFFLGEIIKNIDIFEKLDFRINKVQLFNYLKFGIPLIGLSISNWFLTTSDRYLIKYLDNSVKEVGIYSTNYSLANSIYMMFSLIVVNAYHPIIMKEWSENRENTRKLVSQAIDIYIMFMVPLTVYGCMKSDILLSLFKGNLYASNYEIFNWTAIGIFFYGISLLVHKYYELNNRTSIILLFNIFAAISNIILNVLLIPLKGFAIAAFTTFIAYIIYIVLIRLSTYKKFHLFINKKFIFIELSTALVFYLVDYKCVHSNTILGFLVEGCIYVLYTIIVYQLTGIINVKNVNFLREKLIRFKTR